MVTFKSHSKTRYRTENQQPSPAFLKDTRHAVCGGASPLGLVITPGADVSVLKMTKSPQLPGIRRIGFLAGSNAGCVSLANGSAVMLDIAGPRIRWVQDSAIGRP